MRLQERVRPSGRCGGRLGAGSVLAVAVLVLPAIAAACTGGESSAGTTAGDHEVEESGEQDAADAGTSGPAVSTDAQPGSGCGAADLTDPAMWPGQTQPIEVTLPPGPTVAGTDGLAAALEVLGMPGFDEEPVSEGQGCSVVVGEPALATLYLQPVGASFAVMSAFWPDAGMAWGYSAVGDEVQVHLSDDFCGGEPTCRVEVSVRFGGAEASGDTSVDSGGGEVDLTVGREATAPGTVLMHATDAGGTLLVTLGTQLPAGDSSAG